MRNPGNPDRILGRILEVFRRSRTFFLSGHQNPDPDTIGSELALRSFLLRTGSGKRVDIYNTHPAPSYLGFLPGFGSIKTAKKISKHYDCAVIMECGSPDRMGNIIDLATQARWVVNVDHHLHNGDYGDFNLIDPRVSSNAEQIQSLLRRAGRGITPGEATCLYAGLVTDTGRFQYSNTSPGSHRAAGELIAHGAQSALVCQKIYMEKPRSALRLLAYALSNMKLLERGRLALFVLPAEVLRRLKTRTEDAEDIVNYGLWVPTAEASILLKPSDAPGRVKVSMRAKDRIDVNRVARFFGGGGHRKASGCTVTGRVPEVARRVIARLKKAL